jgi:hypothetical protein
MPKHAIQPSLIPDARIVRMLEVQLPAQPIKIDAICRLLAYDDTTRPTESDVLRALQDLEERGMAKRVPGQGWAKDNRLFNQKESNSNG